MNPIKILLIEDNDGDILLTKEALENKNFKSELEVAKNGSLAIEYLEKILLNKTEKLPQLILLDINLPKKNGQEVLKHIKTNDNLKHIPVIMLTTSSTEKDVRESYKNQANCYIVKPVDVNDYMKTIEEVKDFWTKTATIPIN